ncbi:hypothetical protein KPSA1_01061 [Pseudomonas syringae pv. actinidiae]|uniref:Uncharacterized protein n=1 Tax=Pseudomonas syringae pv. actinidiae TaxID=103796 RepID=A0A2V0Q5H8_PSESF|nr:hypothetical protein KPSA1_01061 [Pseudomonas syringae pv. actinidiae]
MHFLLNRQAIFMHWGPRELCWEVLPSPRFEVKALKRHYCPLMR